MRFAYIDSQGNEVAIPSVDALALRIELGAIGPDTELYDAQADRWGPAKTHEIFHTLSRGADDEGFVAPPPPVASPPAGAEPPSPDAAEPEAPVDLGLGVPEPTLGESDPTSDLTLTPELADSPGAGTPPDAPSFELSGDGETESGDGLGFELTLSDSLPEPGAPPPEPPLDEGPSDFGEISLDLAPGSPELEPVSPEGQGGGDEGGFDFGDLSGGLELEPALDDTTADDIQLIDTGGSGIELESAMDFAGTGPMEDIGTSLDPEELLSPPAPESPWAEQDGPETSEEVMDFGAPMAPVSDEAPPESGAPAEGAEPPPRRRPEPRTRPSPPRRKKQLPVGSLLTVVAAGGVAVGGYYGWQAYAAGSAGPPALPPVVIPDIPAPLLPQMRDLAEDALASMLAELVTRSTELDIPPQPRSEWLSGEYLGTASAFGDIEEFWLGIEGFLDEVRSTDAQLFHTHYVAQVEAAGLAPDTAAMLTERADSGFVAARDGRFEAYALMDDLIRASLDLHDFLLTNESQIEYDPAAGGFSRDPILEAVPATEELGDRMWDMVDDITGALDALGTLDRVTTEGLFAVLFDRIRSAGIQ